MAYRLHCIALAACALGTDLHAQEATQQLPSVTITGRARDAADITGFGQPLARTPMQASSLTETDLRAAGAQRLADVVALDAAVSDSYNAAGYWDIIAIRGFTLDSRFNLRRDGLPINGETTISLANKSGLELLKGISGLQAGTSAPGGLANLIVKRPTHNLRSVGIELRDRASVGAQADISQRFGEAERFGIRVNLSAERIDPPLRNADGKRHLVAVAGDWRIADGSLLEAEIERSHQSQPSQPGFSLLGSRVPAPVDPRVNLNNQPWSQPVVLDGTTASLRFTQRLNADWKFVVHAGVQRLKNDDRVAFPFGCSAEGNFDRYCSDGTFDLYDFRSENERRNTTALDLSLRGRAELGGMAHELTAGVLASRFKSRFQRQAFNPSIDLGTGLPGGTGNTDGTLITGANPALTDENTNRDERSTELYLRDAVQLAPAWQAWLGLRTNRIERRSVRTDGSRAIDYAQTFTTPWLALSHEILPRQFVYVSWGQGIESEVVPNRVRYTNAGQALPALKSRQAELGAKGTADGLEWSVAAFDIRRPQTAGVGIDCFSDAVPGTCTLQFDGRARHRGIEGGVGIEAGAWTVSASAMWLHARREGSADATLNGQRPPNVPAQTLKARAGYRIAALPGLTASAALVHEGERTILPNDGALRIPSWTRADLAASCEHKIGDTALTWRAGIDNLADRRAWRESPYQFSHVYLYPLPGRTWRLSLQADL